jgi:hypothetical protein
MKQYRFRRWLRNWITNFDSDHAGLSVTKESTIGSRSLNSDHHPMNFQIYRASGGYIVEFSRYDRKRDEANRNLHIITDEQDLGDSISKIVTLEMLRN